MRKFLLIGSSLVCIALTANCSGVNGSESGKSGEAERTLQHQDRERRYIVHVPKLPAPAAGFPVVLNFHGGGGNAADHQSYTGLDRVADREGFITVYPFGSGRFSRKLLTWNAGECCGYAKTHEIDDVGFVKALLNKLAEEYSLDPTRIYATGLSNGSMMAYRLAMELSESIAAIAPVAGAMSVAEFKPQRPIPIMHVHSVDDPRALYDGGLGPRFPFTNARVLHPPVESILKQWIEADGCPTVPIIAEVIHGAAGTHDQSHTATKLTYGPGKDGVEVILWKLTGAGHVWPGGLRNYHERLLGPSTAIIDVNEEMWRFFKRFHL
jgi:polyhydroxybutyrate depolymerase